MHTRALGHDRLKVGALGYGAMTMSGIYEPADENSAVAALRRAVELGITLVDTSDYYGKGQRQPDSEQGHNEKLVGRALQGHRDQAVLATKVGYVFTGDGTPGLDGGPDHIRAACEASLQRLGVDYIDLYYLHRVDPKVPVEESIGAMAGLVEEGKVRHLGVSEPSAENVRRAHATHPVTAVQSEYSLVTRDVEAEVLPTCRELGIGFIPFASLGRGLLTGTIRRAEDMALTDWRRTTAPRFQSENLQANLDLVDLLREIADRRGVALAQLALAWRLHQGDDVVPLFGAPSPPIVDANSPAADLLLSDGELTEIDAIFPPDAATGERYPEEYLRDVAR